MRGRPIKRTLRDPQQLQPGVLLDEVRAEAQVGSGGIELQEVVCLFLITSRASFDSLQRSRMTTSRSRVPEHAAGERMVLWLSSLRR